MKVVYETVIQSNHSSPLRMRIVQIGGSLQYQFFRKDSCNGDRWEDLPIFNSKIKLLQEKAILALLKLLNLQKKN